MENMKDSIIIRIVKVLDVILVGLPFGYVWLNYYNHLQANPYLFKGNIVVICLYLLLYFVLGRVYDAFTLALSRITDLIGSQILSALLSDGILYIVICLLCERPVSVIPGLLCIVVQLILIFLWCYLANHWFFKKFKPSNVIIVYDKVNDIEKEIKKHNLDRRFNVVDVLNIKDVLKDKSTLNRVKTVFLNDIHSHERNAILKYCVEQSISVYVLPRIGDVIMSGAYHVHMLYLPMMYVSRYNATPEYLFIKRCGDIVLSLIALIILSPLLLITALAIKLNDNGPVFYKQVRLTKDGKEFNILKFRSMKVDAESNGKAVLSKGDNDDRITSVGKIIRKVRIDELPQLINILKGDLTIVGPRPERPEIAKEYEKKFPEFKLRLQAKAGLTGYAQVYGKYNTTPYNKLMMDLMYLAHPSIIDDLKIILATVKILFVPESTDGISDTQTTAMKDNI